MRIGTTVNVLDFGEIYDEYSDMFKLLKFKDQTFNSYPDKNDTENWKTFTKVTSHLIRTKTKVVGIQKGDAQLLINVTALTIVTKTKVSRR